LRVLSQAGRTRLLFAMVPGALWFGEKNLRRDPQRRNLVAQAPRLQGWPDRRELGSERLTGNLQPGRLRELHDPTRTGGR